MKSRGPKPPFGSVRNKPKSERLIDFSKDEESLPLPGEFLAQYPGRCASCGRSFPSGERVRYDEADELIAISCCGPDEAERAEAVEGELVVDDIKSVLPRVRRPACPRCFQIPANSGECGC